MTDREVVEIVKAFQCPGCMSGPDPSSCPEFDIDANLGSCAGHQCGTYKVGAGLLALGLPKGFDRVRSGCDIPIRILDKDSNDFKTWYDRFNLPFWGIEEEGYLILRVYSPRIDRCEIHIVKGAKLSDVDFSVTNVREFYDDID